jgi:outer membrane immunogenic protein
MNKGILTGLFLSAIASSAFAADMPLKAVPAPPPVPTCEWCGFYIGAHGGWAQTRDGVVDMDRLNGGASYQMKASGFIGGGQAGYNWQTGVLVLGIEGDIGELNASTRRDDPNFIGGTFTTLHSGVYGDITGRIGVAVQNMLFYLKGGWAQFDGHGSINNTKGGFGGGEAFTGDFSGAVYGIGFEYMFLPSWSAKIEYRHFDFGTQISTLVTPANGNFRYSHNVGVDAVTAGVNWHFKGF